MRSRGVERAIDPRGGTALRRRVDRGSLFSREEGRRAVGGEEREEGERGEGPDFDQAVLAA